MGNLESKRDFTDARDMVKAYWLIMQKGEPGDVYNICSENAIFIKDILSKFLSMSKKEIKIKQEADRFRNLEVPLFFGDATKIKKKTGWKLKISLEINLQGILDYWRKKI